MRILLASLVILLACVSSAQAQEPTRWKAVTHSALVFMVAASGADLAATEHCLGARTCHELNPVLQPFSARPSVFGAVKMGETAAVAWALAHWHEQHPKLTSALAIGLGVAYSAATVANSHLSGSARPSK